MALDISKSLFGSDARLGQIIADDHGKGELLSSKLEGAAEFIEVDDRADIVGHSYFLSNKSVRRDIVAIIKGRIKTGDPGRPLVNLKEHYWKLAE